MRIAVALLALPLLGCWGDGHSSGVGSFPHVGVPPLVVVAPDSFDLVPVGPVGNGTFDYDWPCSQGQANLVIGGFSGGSVRIAIQDDDGATVHDNIYTGGLAGGITAMTSPGGAPGLWRLEFTFHNFVSIGAIDITADTYDEPDAIVIGGSFALDTVYEFEAGWPAGPAQVVIGTSISHGFVRVQLWDGAGELVMDRTHLAVFVGQFDGESDPGAAGKWRIRIEIDAVATAGAITIDHP